MLLQGNASVVGLEVTCGQIGGVNRTKYRRIDLLVRLCVRIAGSASRTSIAYPKIREADRLAYPVPRSAADSSNEHTATNWLSRRRGGED